MNKLGLALVFLGIAIVGCGPSKEDTSRLQAAKSWMDSYYAQFPIGGGWQYESSEISGNKVVMYVSAPAAPSEDSAIRGVCPPPAEQVWNVLDSKQDIEVSLQVGGNIVRTADCRN